MTNGNYSYSGNVRVLILSVLQALLRMLSEPFTVFSDVPVSWATCAAVGYLSTRPDVCQIVTCDQQSENVRIAVSSKRCDSQCDN